jgi:hypothetical protein
MPKDRTITNTVKTGTIVLPDAPKVVDCLVHEISDTGAHLKVSAPLRLPHHFTLLAADQSPRRASVVWWDVDAVGIHFDGT